MNTPLNNSELKVFLVDDEEHVRNDAAQLAEDCHVNMVTHSAAESLYKMLIDIDVTADLFLVDEELPGLSSAQLIQDIRATRRHRETPIFVLCSDFNSNYRDVSKRIGVNGWVKKPFDQKLFQSLLNTVTEHNLPAIKNSNIAFNIKMGKLEISWDNDLRIIKCKGAVAENAWFGRILYLLPAQVEEVVIDWGKVSFVNVEGVKAWHAFYQKEKSKFKKIIFQNCPYLLVEFMVIMPQFFSHIWVSSMHIPVLQRDPMRMETFLLNLEKKDDLKSQLGEGKRKGEVIGDTNRYLQINDYLKGVDISSLLKDKSKAGRYWSSYLDFLRVVNENALIEMTLTREAILDQSSRILARIASFDKAVQVLEPSLIFPKLTRKEIVETILDIYNPILSVLDSLSQLIKFLCLKWHETDMENEEGELESLFFGWEDQYSERLAKLLVQNNALEYEAVYARKLEEQDLITFTQACLQACQVLMSEMKVEVENAGVHLIFHLRIQFSVEERLKQARQVLKSGDYPTEQLLQFRWESSLWWKEQLDSSSLIDEALNMLTEVSDYFYARP